eukprot:352865-Chlamydomonas_euryale.AAC.5
MIGCCACQWTRIASTHVPCAMLEVVHRLNGLTLHTCSTLSPPAPAHVSNKRRTPGDIPSNATPSSSATTRIHYRRRRRVAIEVAEDGGGSLNPGRQPLPRQSVRGSSQNQRLPLRTSLEDADKSLGLHARDGKEPSVGGARHGGGGACRAHRHLMQRAAHACGSPAECPYSFRGADQQL